MIVLLAVTAAHIRAFESCLARQHFISDWMGELKLNKLSTGCRNEMKGLAVEKATNPVGGFYFSPGFAGKPCFRQNRHATQATLQYIYVTNIWLRKCFFIPSNDYYFHLVDNLSAFLKCFSLCKKRKMLVYFSATNTQSYIY